MCALCMGAGKSLTLHAMNSPKGWAPGSDQAETLALTVAKTMAEDKAAQSLTSWNILRGGGGRGP